MRKTTLIANGAALRFAKFIGEAPATPAIATITPAIGDEALPMLEASCVGSTKAYVGRLSLAAMPGISGPKEKKAALPLPISIAAKKMMSVKTTIIAIPFNPALVDSVIRLLMKSSCMSPLENISEATIRVTTLPNTLPMPCQKAPKA